MIEAKGQGLAPGLAVVRHAQYALLIYATRAMAAFMVGSAFGMAATLAIGAWPGSDLVLTEPGGLMLSEWVRLQQDTLRVLLTQGALVVVAMIPIGMVTSTLLLVSLCEPHRVPLADALRRCGAHLTPTVVVYLVIASFQAAVIWFFYVLVELVNAKFISAFGVRGADLAYVGILAAAVFAAFASSIVHDVIRVAIVRRRLTTLAAMALGWSVSRRHWAELLGALWPRAAGSVLVVVLSLLWLKHAGMGTSTRLALAAVVQQVAALSIIALRANWLSRVVEIVGGDEEAEPDGELV